MTHHSPAMSGVSSVFAGDACSVGAARRWTREVLSAAGLCDQTVDDAMTCVSELATNTIVHTRSGDPGGTYRLTITVHREYVRIEVIDQGSEQAPSVEPGNGESGRGLLICSHLGLLDHATTGDGHRRVRVQLPRPPSARTPNPHPATSPAAKTQPLT